MAKTGEVEVVLVGDELLKGDRRDSHLAFLGRALLAVGVRVNRAHVVGDERQRIAELIRDRASRCQVILVSGGLGPTHDDVTREGVADGLGLPLEFREREWETIQRMFGRFGRKADASNRRQAYFPKGAEPIPNERGTAAGFVLDKDGCLVAVMPGPPRELIPMVEGVVMERIVERLGRQTLFRETFRTTGIGESNMTPIVKPIFDRFTEFVVSSLPHIGGVDIVVTQRSDIRDEAHVRARAVEFERELHAALGHRLFGKGRDELAAVVGDALAERRETVAIAESLTGGLIGKRITDVAGSSRYLLADVVAYSNEAKVLFLGVANDSLKQHGAVSEIVCREMAEGIRHRTGATYGAATTGIAGPGGGSKEKPIGLTYYGLSWDGGVNIRRGVFPGNREDVRERVSYAVMFMLHERLQRGG